ncbi:hypothetical protein NDU88_003306 [Pleurodeles waltl]|uniref:Uncharacterized protein n=1 Tax=Pleurodeles waltl TaxID=8319 RepID=A0AAV7UZL9_PLEWA|nr:hypothetical protein NDU88_003306 [Pleurodeles waltl]
MCMGAWPGWQSERARFADFRCPGPETAQRRDPSPPQRAGSCGSGREQRLGAAWGGPSFGGRALGLDLPRGGGAGRAVRGWRRRPGRVVGLAAGVGGRPDHGPPPGTTRAVVCGPWRRGLGVPEGGHLKRAAAKAPLAVKYKLGRRGLVVLQTALETRRDGAARGEEKESWWKGRTWGAQLVAL